MPDQDRIIDDEEKAPIAAKIALLIGLLVTSSLTRRHTSRRPTAARVHKFHLKF